MQDLTILDSDGPAIVALKKNLSQNIPLSEQSTQNQLLNFILTLIACVSTVAWIWFTLFMFSSVLGFVFALFGFWIVLGLVIYTLDEMFCGIPEQIRRGKVREEARLNNIIDKENRELLAKQEAEALEAKEILRQRHEEENAQLMNEALRFYLLNKKGVK
jgi:hypothetical protein